MRRPAHGLFAGLWSPPAVEIPLGVDPASTISSAIDREPSVKTGELTELGTVLRRLTHRTLELRVFGATLVRLPPRAEGWRLAPRSALGELGIPTAMRETLALAGDRADLGGASDALGRGGGLAAGSKESSFRRLSQSELGRLDVDDGPPELVARKKIKRFRESA